MRAVDGLFIAISHNVSFMGKTWWMLMLVLRLLVLLFAGFTLFSDEQERFICNTIQPGCSNVCFDVFSPVSVLRLWLFHLLLLCLPHVLFATYVTHKVLSRRCPGAYGRSRGGSPLTLESSSSSSHKSPLQEQLQDVGAPRFYCSYVLVVALRICVEAAFGTGQFVLFGLSVPRSFLCYEAPCTSGVECYISRPTEKTLMLNFMLAVASMSVLLSLADLGSSVKAMLRWRSKREMFMEEQSSTFTSTTMTEDSDVPQSRRISLSGSSRNGLRDEKPAAEAPHFKTFRGHVKTAEPVQEPKLEPCSPAAPPHYVLHSHLRPPLSPRPDRGPPPLSPRAPTPGGGRKPGHSSSAETHSGQQSDCSDSQDKRAWV